MVFWREKKEKIIEGAQKGLRFGFAFYKALLIFDLFFVLLASLFIILKIEINYKTALLVIMIFNLLLTSIAFNVTKSIATDSMQLRKWLLETKEKTQTQTRINIIELLKRNKITLFD